MPEAEARAEVRRLQTMAEWANAGLERLERERDEALAERDALKDRVEELEAKLILRALDALDAPGGKS